MINYINNIRLFISDQFERELSGGGSDMNQKFTLLLAVGILSFSLAYSQDFIEQDPNTAFHGGGNHGGNGMYDPDTEVYDANESASIQMDASELNQDIMPNDSADYAPVTIQANLKQGQVCSTLLAVVGDNPYAVESLSGQDAQTYQHCLDQALNKQEGFAAE